MMRKIILALFIILFTLLNIFLYHEMKPYATIEFEQKTLNVPGYARYCQIYFASKGKYIHNQEYILPKTHKIYHKIVIPLRNPTIDHIRIDPLLNKGEIYIKNLEFIQYNGFQKVIKKIDLNLINTSYMHNLKILNVSNSSIHLLSTGVDPYFPISQKLEIDTTYINYYAIMYHFFILIFLFLLLYILYQGMLKNLYNIQDLIVTFILISYTFFTLFYSSGATPLASILLQIYFILSLFILFKYQKYYRSILKAIGLFLLLIVLTFCSDTANRINQLHTFTHTTPWIFTAIFFPLIFIFKTKFHYHYYKIILSALVIFMILIIFFIHQQHIYSIDYITTFGFRMRMGQWAEKNIIFWYLLLMWGTISFFDFAKTLERTIILLCLLVSAYIIFNAYPVSAKLAFVFSTIFYFIFVNTQWRQPIVSLFPYITSFYIFFMPWIANIFTHYGFLHPRLQSREAIITLSSALVKENFVFGYGFRTSASIQLSNYLPTELLSKFGTPTHIPAMNPHNLSLLVWLNFGMVGSFFFALISFCFLKKLIQITDNSKNQTALLSLIISFTTITSFSWSGWWEITFLTYTLFVSMIFLSLNINKNPSGSF